MSKMQKVADGVAEIAHRMDSLTKRADAVFGDANKYDTPLAPKYQRMSVSDLRTLVRQKTDEELNKKLIANGWRMQVEENSKFAKLVEDLIRQKTSKQADAVFNDASKRARRYEISLRVRVNGREETQTLYMSDFTPEAVESRARKHLQGLLRTQLQSIKHVSVKDLGPEF